MTELTDTALTHAIAAGNGEAETGLLAGVDDALVGAAGEMALATDGDGEGLGHGNVASYEYREAKIYNRCCRVWFCLSKLNTRNSPLF